MPPITRRSLLLTGAVLGTGLGTVVPAPQALAAGGRQSRLTRWQGSALATGTHQGTAATTGGLVWRSSQGALGWRDPHTGRRWNFECATWTSPVVATSLPAADLVASWIASTPVGTSVRISVRARSQRGIWSRWFTLSSWASSSEGPTRTSYAAQSDAVARTATDTLRAAKGVTFAAWQLKVELLRPAGSRVAPSVSSVALVASTAATTTTPVSPVGVARGLNLAVPAYSQMTHRGHYPQWDGGGAAWCSATSLAMVLAYWKKGPSAAETRWVRPSGHRDSQVEQAVRGVYDAGYDGTGNWPFNIAYAGARGLTGFVTRLRSLNEAELFIKAGLPLVVSTAFTRSQLTGAGFGTAGHLMVLRGFDAAGHVRVNDPASSMQASNALVPRTYNRGQFESAWGRNGGLCYVIHPAGRALPARPRGIPAW